jgi:hypothetical protein
MQDEILKRTEAAGERDQGLSLEGVATLTHAFGEFGRDARQALVPPSKRDRRGLCGCGAAPNQSLPIGAWQLISD